MANSYKMNRLNAGDKKLSSETWNGFVQLYEDSKNRTSISGDPLKRPIPPVFNGSTIALAVVKKGQDSIDGYQPVRITEVKPSRDAALALPLYEVEAVDATDVSGNPTERHGNYAFTMAEGVSKKAGGRIVVSGVAAVAVDRDKVTLDASGAAVTKPEKQSYYIVPDKTLSDVTDVLLAPVGHFRLVSWHDPELMAGSKKRSTDKIFLLVDLEKRPTSFLAKVDTTIDASSTASGVITMSSGKAFAFYPVSESTAASDKLEVEKDEANYEIEVYNTYSYTASLGEQLIEYSLELNRFIVVRPQTVKIGKADADIAVDATGAISIWRAGSDTTKNEDAKLDWMAGTTKVSAGKEVMITWFADESIWRITGAECED
tara:strand:- start:2236 stop:3357 length:1122 start_codon:yes stop_codon:yes gene_type:complete